MKEQPGPPAGQISTFSIKRKPHARKCGSSISHCLCRKKLHVSRNVILNAMLKVMKLAKEAHLHPIVSYEG